MFYKRSIIEYFNSVVNIPTYLEFIQCPSSCAGFSFNDFLICWQKNFVCSFNNLLQLSKPNSSRKIKIHFLSGCQTGRAMLTISRFTQIGELRNNFTHGHFLGGTPGLFTEPEYQIYPYFVHNMNLAYWNELNDHTVS